MGAKVNTRITVLWRAALAISGGQEGEGGDASLPERRTRLMRANPRGEGKLRWYLDQSQRQRTGMSSTATQANWTLAGGGCFRNGNYLSCEEQPAHAENS